jgi:hypothetical protein
VTEATPVTGRFVGLLEITAASIVKLGLWVPTIAGPTRIVKAAAVSAVGTAGAE